MLQRMDNILIVVDDLEAVKAFFVELGMELEWETTVEGPAVDRLINLQNVRATLALMRTPDGHGRIELDKFHTPDAIRTGPENVPVNALGMRRIMFAVDDLDDMVARMCAHGAKLMAKWWNTGARTGSATSAARRTLWSGLQSNLANECLLKTMRLRYEGSVKSKQVSR